MNSYLLLEMKYERFFNRDESLKSDFYNEVMKERNESFKELVDFIYSEMGKVCGK